MGSRGGIALIDGGPGLAARLVDVLGPHVAVVTPNRAELAWLVDDTVASADTVSAARALARRAGCAVLAKGGHSGGVRAVDVLVCNDLVHELDGDRIAGGEDVHGTGCALATAIACELARGLALVDACRAAKRFVVARIAAPVVPGRGSAAVL
jgi:hydroxymethylpyrimidine/phosphomethylpyrimidine kinase